MPVVFGMKAGFYSPGVRQGAGRLFAREPFMRPTAAAILALSLAFVLPARAQNVSKDPTRTPNGTYTVNVAHTQVLFAIAHLGLTDYFGRFDKVAGTLSFDGNQPERSALSVTIDTTSVDIPSARLAEDLKGTAVFDTQQFPNATFKSTTVTRTGPATGRIVGVLTIKNVSKPVTLDVTFNGGTQSPMGTGYVLGFHATTTIRRSDFGLTTMSWAPFVGDDVHLIIEAMFDQQKG